MALPPWISASIKRTVAVVVSNSTTATTMIITVRRKVA